MVFFSDVSGLLTSDGGDMGMVGGWVKVISGEVSNGTVISGESPPMILVTKELNPLPTATAKTFLLERVSLA